MEHHGVISSGGMAALVLSSLFVLSGCRSPTAHREHSDRTATRIVEHQQEEVLGRRADFTIETPADTLRRRLLLDQDLPTSGKASLGTDQLDPIPHWPEEDYPTRIESDGLDPVVPRDRPLEISLIQALQVGARNNREYQSQKEDVFRAALHLDLEDYRFRSTYRGAVESTFTEDRGGEEGTVRGVETTGTLGAQRFLRTGADITGRIMFDLVNLLTLDRDSSFGIMADLSVSIPLMRGAGRHIVTEPLTQAERNVVYALYSFEHFKRGFSVRVASEYLAVLQQLDQVENAHDNYERLQTSAERARRLAEAGRLPEIQVDQARQEELRARDRWLAAEAAYERRLDQLKVTLGLPTDARVALDPDDLRRLVDLIEPLGHTQGPKRPDDFPRTRVAGNPNNGTPAEPSGSTDPEPWTEDRAVQMAFDHRLDFQIAHGRVYDAQRAVTVAANQLRADLNLSGTARAGERRGLGTAGLSDAQLRPGEGAYTAGLAMDLPWDRTAERHAYRDSFIKLERATRSVQELEDQIKMEIRSALRNLDQTRESIRIQAQAVELAQRRVESTELFLQAGRVQIRDVLDAQESLIAAQNALTAAVVAHRIAELELQRDTGVLEITEEGLWVEYADELKEERLD